jgi:glycosyltransferase involved in cell wall biosynthesis
MTAIHSLIGTWTNRVSLYITLTEFSRRKFASAAISIPEARLVVKPNFIRDVGRGDATRKQFFLFVGRLVEEKGVLSLLNATRLADFELVIIGDGPLAPIVKEYAVVNPNIHWLGFRDNATVIQYMKSCKALIFPSVWYECFPIALLEAFATGTVVIASRLGAMAEIIRDRVNGLHFTAGDTRELSSLITEVQTDPTWLGAVRDNARVTYLSKYTPERNYEMLMSAYNYGMALMARQKELVYGTLPQGG